MDAVEFIQEEIRMCANFQDCTECPLCDTAYCSVSPKKRPQEEAEEIVRRVEQWFVSHPRQTRQDVFLKQWPNAKIDKDGCLDVCPYLVSAIHRNNDGFCANFGVNCQDCRHEFWGKGIKQCLN